MAKTKAKEKTVIEAIDELAAMTKRGFDDMTERFTGRFDSVDGRFAGVDKRLENLESDVKGLDRKFDSMWYELKDIKKQLETVVHRQEFEVLKERVRHLEDRLTIATRKR